MECNPATEFINKFMKEYISYDEKYSRYKRDGSDNMDMFVTNDPNDCISINSGDLVEIIARTGENDLYVRPADCEAYPRMLESVIRYRQNNPRIAVPLNMFHVGLIVAVKNPVDLNHHRVRILKHDDDVCYVFFVDTGYVAWVPLCRITLLPTELRKPPYFAVPVRLKNIPRTPLVSDADRYLSRMVDGRKVFRIEYENDNKNSIELIRTSRTSEKLLSHVLTGLNVPLWKLYLQSPSPECYATSEYVREIDIRYEDWMIGNKLIDITIIRVLRSSGKCLAVKNGFNEIDLYQEELNEYSRLNNFSYVPQKSEMYLVRNRGKFYRGMCIGSKAGQSTFLMDLVDYGTLCSTEHKDIRRIPEQLRNIPCAACHCKVVNASDWNLGELVNNVVTCKVISWDDDDFEYSVEILNKF